MHLVRLTATLLAVTVLTACSDDPPPKPAPPPPPSAPTETSPTPKPALGPEETVRAWVAARNVTVQTGEIAQVESLSASSCETCVESYGPVAQVHLAGGHYETEGWRISATAVQQPSKAKARVSAGVVYAAGTTVPSAGAAPVTYEVEHHVARFDLALQGGTWKVAAIVYLS